MSSGFLTLAAGYAIYPYAETLAELSAYRVIYAIGIGAVTGMFGDRSLPTTRRRRIAAS